MRILLLTFAFTLLCLCRIGQAAPADLTTGAGSSAAKPLYLKWGEAYAKQAGFKLDYQAIGSSGGIKQIKARSVDFGASDVAMAADELKKEGLITFPTAISGIVPIINLPELKAGELQLSGEVLADIFARKITKWNDPAIVALNPRASLPKTAITLLVRQDGSGTTWNFTDYLSSVSSHWKSSFGRDFTIKWPAEAVALKGSADLVAALKQTVGAISYVDYKYVTQERLNYAQMKNRDGKFIQPSAKTFESALNNSEWRLRGVFEDTLSNRPGSSSWPITAGTFVIVPQVSKNPAHTLAMLKFFLWAFVKGDHLVDGADFVALPDAVQARVYREMSKITDDKGHALVLTPL